MGVGPGYLKGTCKKRVFRKGSSHPIGDAPAYFYSLMEGTYEIKHGLDGTFVKCDVLSGETTIQNFD